MPFNYQSLKQLTSAAIVDGSIQTADIANTTITGSQIVNATITATNLAVGAVDLNTNVVSGALPVAQGGIGLTTLAGANQAIRSNGSTLSFGQHGIQGLSVFTGNSTWTKPAGVRYIRVQLQAGAGGGSGHGEGGGAGGYSERFLDVTAISSVNVTIGGGGSGTYYASAGSDGGASSFGPYLSASAGHGANRQNQHSGGVSGVGSGGNLNLHMGGGLSHHAYSAQSCADTYFGGGAPSSHPQGGHFAHNHQNHTAPGTGGAGAHFHGHRGSDGRPGIVIVTNYY
jgi:hypothetical protein